MTVYSNPTPRERQVWKDLVKTSNRIAGHYDYPWGRDKLAHKAAMAERIAERAQCGQVGIYVWQMDCDCASWDTIVVLPATFVHVNHYLDDLYQYAEGPVRWELVNPSEQEGFKSTRRDHALEAYEDGHPHSIYL